MTKAEAIGNFREGGVGVGPWAGWGEILVRELIYTKAQSILGRDKRENTCIPSGV